jgi:hypothetical protein
MGVVYTGCEEAGREHNWYRWYWSGKNSRYERECSTMGCEAFQFLKGSRLAAGRIVLVEEGEEHVHDWKPWGPVEEFHVKENRFYDRWCRTCSAREETEELRQIGTTVFFPWQEAR